VRGQPLSKNRLARAGLIATLLCAVAVYFGFRKDNPFNNPFEVRAAFRDVSQLQPRSPVRIAGVDVGKVKSIEPLTDDPQGGAMVTFELKDQGLPIHRDARAKVRPRIFLEGNYFIDLQPGTPSAPRMERGGTIPVQNTAAPVQFGQFLEMLQSDTRQDLRTVLQEYSRALEGEGARGFNRSTQYWKPAFQNSAIVNDATRGLLEHDLSDYIAGASRVAEGLDRFPDRLQTLITSFAQTAGAFAREQDNLSAALDELPNTLRIGFRAFGSLREAFPDVRRFARTLAPTVRESGPSLDATLPFVTQLRGLVSEPELQGLVRDLRPVVPSLVELNEGGLKLAEQTRLAGSCQLNSIIPWNESTIPDPNFPGGGKIYQEASKQFVGLAAESRSFDANGQYVRSYAQTANYASVLGDGRFFFTSAPVLGVNPPKKATPPPYRANVPCETQEPPDLRSKPDQAPQQVRINQNAPGAAERRAEVDAALVKWMRRALQSSPLDGKLTVSDEPITAADLPAVKRTLEGGGE
jgi:virulence factor Mce-like protein